MKDGVPVAYACRSFSAAGRNYCQIEKELLAAVFVHDVLISTLWALHKCGDKPSAIRDHI